MIHFILHVTGIDTQQSPWYDFWSGIATQGAFLAAIIAGYRNKNCHKKWCPRLGQIDPVHHHPACKKHHSHSHLLD